MNKEAHDPSQPQRAMPADVEAWLAAQPEAEQADLRRTWTLAALARAETAGPEAVANATERLRAALEASSPSPRTLLDRPPRRAVRRWGMPRLGWGILGLLVGIGLGLLVGQGPDVEAPDGRKEFMILLRGGDFEGRSPAERERVVAEFSEWARTQAEAGRLRAGDELDDGGRVLRAQGGRLVDRPLATGPDGIGGYFIVAAATYDEAAEIARGCPQLRYGGAVELRQVIRR